MILAVLGIYKEEKQDFVMGRNERCFILIVLSVAGDLETRFTPILERQISSRNL